MKCTVASVNFSSSTIVVAISSPTSLFSTISLLSTTLLFSTTFLFVAASSQLTRLTPVNINMAANNTINLS